MAVGQQALTIVAPIKESAREGLAARLDAIADSVIDALTSVKSLHFARFVLIQCTPGDAKGVLRLAFESNYDGELFDHLAELLEHVRASSIPDLEGTLFGGWDGYGALGLHAFCDEHSFRAQAFYLGHPGLSVVRIQKDRALRKALERAADGIEDPGSMTALEIRAELLRAANAEPNADFDIRHVDRGLPPDWSSIVFWGTLVLVVIVAIVLLPVVLVVEQDERRTEGEPSKPNEKLLDEIAKREDAKSLNGLTHLVPLRKSRFRKLTMRAVLAFVEIARKFLCYKGDLTGIQSIHFARWAILDDDTVIFFSNYDGSWESYLGDFVDKAHYWLTAAWMGSYQFPPTRAWILGGAAKEAEFKEWTRRWQLKNQIWYGAYPDTSMANVLKNAEIREGAARAMTEEEALAWLALI